MRQVTRLLKQGKIVCIHPDQDTGLNHTIFAPFFGIDAATTPIVSRLALITGAKVLQYSQQRTHQDQRYLITISDSLASIPSGDLVADVTKINAAIETKIRLKPSQYLWLHRRFKTRPKDSPTIY